MKENSKTKLTKEVDIVMVKHGIRFQKRDVVINENILKVFINGTEYFKMVFTPKFPKELAVGFLYTQGIIDDKGDIESIDWNEEFLECRLLINNEKLERLNKFQLQNKTKGSSGGMVIMEKTKGDLLKSKKDDINLNSEEVLNLITSHYKHSELFMRTGAVHSCGICTKNELLYYYEDIGRHNAVDKMAGDVLLRQLDISDKIATLSCRMSLEIIEKIIKTGIKIVISNAAPTISSLKLAEKSGLTIIGFARDNRFNIYTHGWRIEKL